MTPTKKLAIVGCGSIVSDFHLPVLAGHSDIDITALIDSNIKRAKGLAKDYSIERCLTSITELTLEDIDGVVIATPPATHSKLTIPLLRQGIHVLTEKPMATNSTDAESMCAAAEEGKAKLSVGHYKRLLPASSLVKTIIETGIYGDLISVKADWGGMSAYGSATLGLMKKSQAGGGVLMDIGPHVLDVVVDWLGKDWNVLQYQDDSRGGIEADCEATIEFLHENQLARQAIPLHLRLSRIRNLQNHFLLDFDDAKVTLEMNEKCSVRVNSKKGDLEFISDTIQDDQPYSTYHAIRTQLDDWLDTFDTDRQPVLSGESAARCIQLIQDCYAAKETRTHLAHDTRNIQIKDKQRVLVTGAGGFIGTRVVDRLVQDGCYDIRAHVRRPSSASRIARHDIELVQGDLQNTDDIERIVSNCDAVVHCAVGTDYGSPKNIYNVTVNGTKSLVDFAVENGVKRFVHLSSIAVHDANRSGAINSQTPIITGKADWYGYTKSLAEKEVLNATSKGLQPIVIRPGCVYGPFGYTFVMNPLRALNEDRLILQDCAITDSNTVHVDNLAHAISLAVSSPDSSAIGSAFPVGDDESWTWGQYFGFFAEQCGKQVKQESIKESATPQGSNKSQQFGMIQALKSKAGKEFAKTLLKTRPWGWTPDYLLKNVPVLESITRQAMGMNEPVIFRLEDCSSNTPPIRFTARNCSIDNSDTKQKLGFECPINRNAAMQQTFEWVKSSGLLSPVAWSIE